MQNRAYEGYIYRVSGYGVEAVGKRMAMLEFVSFDDGSVAEAEAEAAVVDDDAEVPERLLRLVSAASGPVLSLIRTQAAASAHNLALNPCRELRYA